MRRYGDNVEEMDAGVGKILDALTRHNLDNNTIVYFVSDHGAHLEAIAPDGQRTGGYNGRFKGESQELMKCSCPKKVFIIKKLVS